MLLTLLIYLFIFLFICAVVARVTCGVCKSSNCLVGKVALVTGGNSGIGYQVCLNLASRGCKVIIADRDDSNESRKEIINLTSNPNIVSKRFDLASFKSIRKFVNEINATEPQLDILINNAGIVVGPKKLTEDGLNYVLQVNYFGPFLLTHLLNNLLKKSTSSRIVFTSSIFAMNRRLTYDGLKIQDPKRDELYNLSLYSYSKSATILAAELFAEKLKNDGIVVSAVHPGWVHTPIYLKFVELGGFAIILANLINVLSYVYGKSPWEGSQTTVYAAITDDIEKIRGQFLADCTVNSKLRCKWDGEFKKKIWKLSETVSQLQEEEKLDVY